MSGGVHDDVGGDGGSDCGRDINGDGSFKVITSS